MSLPPYSRRRSEPPRPKGFLPWFRHLKTPQKILFCWSIIVPVGAAGFLFGTWSLSANEQENIDVKEKVYQEYMAQRQRKVDEMKQEQART